MARKDIIIGGASNYSWNHLKYWINSIAKSGFTGDVNTTEGKEALQEFALDMAAYITEAENKELDNRAKDMVLKELKS